MATFLVTGGAGYVGSHTVKALARAGHTCITYDDLSTGHRDFVRWGPLVQADIRDRQALDAVFATQAIDGVLHFAARAYVGESVQHPGRYYDVNINGTRTLLDAMIRAAVKRIIFSSSCAIYGAHDGALITEDLPKDPINPYGFSKLVCERMMDDYDTAHALASVRLRYFNAAGADPDGEIGEHHEPETHLIPLVLEAAAKGSAVTVFGTDYDTPDGTAVRDYVHVADLATAHLAAAEHLLKGGATTFLNLGTGKGASVREIVHAARKVTGQAIHSVDAARRPGDPASLVADAQKAQRTLNWRPTRSDPHALLRDAWSWQQQRFGPAAQSAPSGTS